MEKNCLSLICCLTSVILFSCSSHQPDIEVLAGNSRFARGDYAGATVSYMKALGGRQSEPWIYYNLANTYNSLGEIDPAIGLFLDALQQENPELLYRTHFNLGDIYYELGDYQQAVMYFKGALKAEPGDVDAKINLELAVKKYQSTLDAALDETAGALSQQTGLTPGVVDVLSIIQQEEEAVWKKITRQEITKHAEDW